MSAPTPWSVQTLHGAPTVVDAEGYTVIPIGGVRAFDGQTDRQLMEQIVAAVNAQNEHATLARIALRADLSGVKSPRAHHARNLLALSAAGGLFCVICEGPVPADVTPLETLAGKLELLCDGCRDQVVEARAARLELVR